MNKKLLDGITDDSNDGKGIIRELANTNLSKYWILDFLETNYRLYFSLSIVSFFLFLISSIKYDNSYIFLIISFFQYLSACDYKNSFSYSFYPVSRVMKINLQNKNEI